MKLIVGLGNPGEKYVNSRHNVGFRFLDALREKFLYYNGIYCTDWQKEDTFNSNLSFLKEGSKVIAILQKPLTYMNRSGDAVVKIARKYEISNIEEDLILIHDDLDLDLGKFKIQTGKSPVGHNGVNNIEEKLKTTKFKRVRIGIENRGELNTPGEDYVLLNFLKSEKIIVDEVIQDAIEGVLADILM